MLEAGPRGLWSTRGSLADPPGLRPFWAERATLQLLARLLRDKHASAADFRVSKGRRVLCQRWNLDRTGRRDDARQFMRSHMSNASKSQDWTKPAAMAIPKEGYFTLEQGRYGPTYPRT